MSEAILVLVSGEGTNLEALLRASREGRFGGAAVRGVVSDRPGVFALERARRAGVPAFVEAPDRGLAREAWERDLSDRILARCREGGIGLIVLAGFLSILTGELLREYRGRIINLHPSLLPKFGGRGMYGERVHRAVLAAGERVSGCTVHEVEEGADTGPVILRRCVPVLPGDTPAALAARVHEAEHEALVEAVEVKLRELRSWWRGCGEGGEDFRPAETAGQ